MAVGISPEVYCYDYRRFYYILWFRKKLIRAGIYWVFAFTGLMGASWVALNFYLGVAGQAIMEALGATALVFFALSG